MNEQTQQTNDGFEMSTDFVSQETGMDLSMLPSDEFVI